MHARCVALNTNSVGPAAGGPMNPLAKGKVYASHAIHRIVLPVHIAFTSGLARWQCSPNAIDMHGTTHRKNTQ